MSPKQQFREKKEERKWQKKKISGKRKMETKEKKSIGRKNYGNSGKKSKMMKGK